MPSNLQTDSTKAFRRATNRVTGSAERMRFLSLFSGIEAASAAWLSLGWEAVAFAEIDKACCRLLAAKFPGVPNLGDVTQISKARIRELGHIDIVIFGSPCQDISIAGKRAGLKGERSGLFFDAMRIVRWSGARLALWENVPGAFSSNEGRDFAAVLGEMGGSPVDPPADGWRNTGVVLGESALVEWSVLDAQWFGVPQRRRRIFALRDSGDWANRPPILLEPESMFGYPPARGKAREDIAGTISARTEGGGGLGTDFDLAGGLIAHTLNAKGGSGRSDFESETFVAHSLRAEGFDASDICSIQGCGKPCHSHGMCSSHAHRFRRHGDPLAGRVSEGEPLGFP